MMQINGVVIFHGISFLSPPQASTIDGRRKGACLFCQEYFMDLYLLAELKTISLKVTTVDMLKPPPDFRTNFEATPPPILIDNGLAVLENEKIERHIMKNVPGGHNLFVQDKDVASRIENVYSVSIFYIFIEQLYFNKMVKIIFIFSTVIEIQAYVVEERRGIQERSAVTTEED